jgi:hypothetical protein
METAGTKMFLQVMLEVDTGVVTTNEELLGHGPKIPVQPSPLLLKTPSPIQRSLPSIGAIPVEKNQQIKLLLTGVHLLDRSGGICKDLFPVNAQQGSNDQGHASHHRTLHASWCAQIFTIVDAKALCIDNQLPDGSTKAALMLITPALLLITDPCKSINGLSSTPSTAHTISTTLLKKIR